MSFKDLKKNAESKIEQFREKAQEGQNKKQDDDRFWEPTVDDSGNGFAIIRFLPEPQDEDFPWVKQYKNAFEGPGGWYIEGNRSSLGSGEPDPVSELNHRLYGSGLESDKEIAKKQKRKLSYISNILVVSDPKKPECEGKVYLWKYGKKIFEMVEDKMSPKFPGEVAFVPFSFWDGANFRLKIRKVDGYRNYDKSEFESPSQLLGGDDKKLEAIWKQQYSLKAFLDPKNYKSYEELQKRLLKALGNTVIGSGVPVITGDEPVKASKAAPTKRPEAAAAKGTDAGKPTPSARPASAAAAQAESGSLDADMANFERIAAGDNGNLEDDDIPF